MIFLGILISFEVVYDKNNIVNIFCVLSKTHTKIKKIQKFEN